MHFCLLKDVVAAIMQMNERPVAHDQTVIICDRSVEIHPRSCNVNFDSMFVSDTIIGGLLDNTFRSNSDVV